MNLRESLERIDTRVNELRDSGGEVTPAEGKKLVRALAHIEGIDSSLELQSQIDDIRTKMASLRGIEYKFVRGEIILNLTL